MAGPADASPAGAVPQPRRRWRRALAETAIMILVAVLLAGLVRAFVLQTFWFRFLVDAKLYEKKLKD